ncbi:MAG: hypothetical protein FD130_2448 [Halothiobacillaceae bacterium]|nr:MAG: hypothetical protein FD130_2448 [Halothiobacillaceae bacterium]
MKKAILPYVASLAVWGVLAGCEVGQFTQTQETPDYTLSLTYDPHPLKAGSVAKIYVTLRKNRTGVGGCRVSYQHYLLAEADKPRHKAIAMPEGGSSGIYQVKSEPFDRAGDGELAIMVNCAGREKAFTFPLRVEAAG